MTEPYSDTVAFTGATTIWFNTGSLCNIACEGCFTEGSPENDRLQYLTMKDLTPFLDEIAALGWPVGEIAFTGGEPFLNPQLVKMMETSLERGYRVLVTTNAMKPMQRQRLQQGLKRLVALYGDRLTLRVSLDHWERERHDALRGPGSYDETLAGLDWLRDEGLHIAVAGRAHWGLADSAARAGYASLFAARHYEIDAGDRAALLLLPDLDPTNDSPAPDIPASATPPMCATSRMVVRGKLANAAVQACPLLPYEAAFSLGETLAESAHPVAPSHPFCTTFCRAGGASCTI